MDGVSIHRTGLLRISGRYTDIEAEYQTTTGDHRNWDPTSEAGPVFFEETTYHLYVAGEHHSPTIRHRDPLFSKNLTEHRRQRVIAGSVNFGRQVGETQFEIGIGPERVSITIEVVPTKIDYTADYLALVEGVQYVSRALALAYLRSTHQSAAHTSERASALEWIASLRHSTDDLSNAIQHINRRPYRHLQRGIRTAPSHRLRRPDAIARRAIMRGKGSGTIDQVPGIGPIRETIPAVIAEAALDTPEHRWLADQLETVEQRLQQMAQGLDDPYITHDGGQIAERDVARRDEIRHIARRIQELRNMEVISTASRLDQGAPPSLTLMTAPGYREAYQVLTSLRLALDLRDGPAQLELKDLHDLYEIWCFLEIVAIVSRLTRSQPEPQAVITSSPNGLHVGLKQGQQSDIVLPGDQRTLTLSFNRSYDGDTGSQRPDIVLIVHERDRPQLIIALDAKYRVDASESFRRRHGAPGPPIAAVNELHRYRDAIVSETSSQTYRPTVQGAALFPLTVEETATFELGSSLYRSLGSLGIGALPFLPGNTELVESWLSSLLSAPIEQLAWNGPPGPATMTHEPPRHA